MKSKKKIMVIAGSIAAVLLLAVVLFFALGGAELFRDFDASGYTRAVLDQTFQGKVEEAAGMIEEPTKEELYAQ